MKPYFRFLINVDKCLNMAYYNMFFYKLMHEGAFRNREVEIAEDGQEDSLHLGIAEMTMLLNKAPFQVDDFQIIAAIRMQDPEKAGSWRETLLYRLLRLWYELQEQKIHIGSEERLESQAGSHVMSIIVFYPSDFSTRIPEPSDYLSKEGLLRTHLRWMLAEGFGFRQDEDYAAMDHRAFRARIRETLDRWNTEKAVPDRAVMALMERYLENDLPEDASGTVAAGSAGSAGSRADSNFEQLVSVVQKEMCRFQLEEELLDRNSRKNEILSLFQLVEFITASEKASEETNLSVYCKSQWERIRKDTWLQEKYARMLNSYRQKLHSCLDEDGKTPERSNTIPNLEDRLQPDAGAGRLRKIHLKEEAYALFQDPQDNTRKKRMLKDLDNELSAFEKQIGRSSGDELLDRWKGTCDRISTHLNDLKLNLQLFGKALSMQYVDELKERRKTQERERNLRVNADQNEMEQERTKARKERESRWNELKQSHMNPTILYQDELNVRSQLEQCNLNIHFLVEALKHVRLSGFVVLILLFTAVSALYYGLLQPYVFFSELEGISVYVLYMLAALALMFFAWNRPGRHYRKQIRQSIRDLRKALEIYLTGYYDRGNAFYVYINTMNDLDIIQDYLEMTGRIQDEQSLQKAKMEWHRKKIREHLSKLKSNSFHSLLETAEVSDPLNVGVFIPKAEDWNQSCIHSRIYWPQEEGRVD